MFGHPDVPLWLWRRFGLPVNRREIVEILRHLTPHEEGAHRCAVVELPPRRSSAGASAARFGSSSSARPPPSAASAAGDRPSLASGRCPEDLLQQRLQVVAVVRPTPREAAGIRPPAPSLGNCASNTADPSILPHRASTALLARIPTSVACTEGIWTPSLGMGVPGLVPPGGYTRRRRTVRTSSPAPPARRHQSASGPPPHPAQRPLHGSRSAPIVSATPHTPMLRAKHDVPALEAGGGLCITDSDITARSREPAHRAGATSAAPHERPRRAA
jgi:hypothetical protein